MGISRLDIIDNNGIVVARGIAHADQARLIAAAPNLLLSCMELWEAIMAISHDWETADMQTERMERAKTAITKALGEWPLDKVEIADGPDE